MFAVILTAVVLVSLSARRSPPHRTT